MVPRTCHGWALANACVGAILVGLAIVGVGAAAGCDSESACEMAFVGDPAEPIEIVGVIAYDGRSVVAVPDGGSVPLLVPPQGGKIIPVTVRATNLSIGDVQLTGWLFDEAAGVFGLEERPMVYELAADGVAEPSAPLVIPSYVNIAACPSAGLPRDVHDQEWTIGLRIRDCAGRTREITWQVTPSCGQPEVESECRCQCSADYMVGDPCP